MVSYQPSRVELWSKRVSAMLKSLSPTTLCHHRPETRTRGETWRGRIIEKLDPVAMATMARKVSCAGEGIFLWYLHHQLLGAKCTLL